MNTKLINISLIFILFATNLLSGPPFLTDDTDTRDYEYLEILITSQSEIGNNTGSGSLPHFEINYTPMKNLQLHLLTPFRYNHSNGDFNYGFSDIELGFKYRFINETDNLPEVGTSILIEVPTGNEDKGLGHGKFQAFLPIFLAKSWGDWSSYCGGGFWYNPGVDNLNWVFTGWQIQRKLTEFISLGGEVYYHTKVAKGEKNHVGINFGGYLNFDETHHLLFSIGQTFPSKNYTLYLGLSWNN